MCPHCGQNAPVVYRGIVAYCTACNAPRPPLTGSALHLAGQPSRVGGVVASVAGWVTLFGGVTIAMIVGALFGLIFGGAIGLLAMLPVAIATALLAWFFLRGGKQLQAKGASRELHARSEAIRALATHRNGVVDASMVAQSLSIPLAEADALLGALAREDYEHVSVDIDAHGGVIYRFVVPGSRVRVDPEIARSPNREEWERLEAEQAAEAAAAARARGRVR